MATTSRVSVSGPPLLVCSPLACSWQFFPADNQHPQLFVYCMHEATLEHYGILITMTHPTQVSIAAT